MEGAMFKPLGIDHVVLRVRDQARSQRFGEALIDLLPATEAGPVGPDHFCLSIHCDDLKAVAKELREKAVALEGDVVQRFGAFGDGPSLYLRDPDGHMIELKPRP